MTIGRRFSARLLAGSALCALIGPSIPALAAEVTYERLLNASAEPQNWLMRMGNYSNWNHSTLSEINRNNVANLKVKFMFSLGDRARPNQGHAVFHADGRGRLHVRGQPVAAVLEARRARRQAQGGVEVRRQGPGRRQERPQRRAARQQHVLQHRQREREPAPGRARQEFRRGGVRRPAPRCRTRPTRAARRRRSRSRTRSSSGPTGKNENGRGYVAAYIGRHRQAPLAVPGRSRAGPARLRDLGRSAHDSDRRRRRLDRAVVRSGDQSRLFRHRQPGAHVRPAGPAGRQSLHQLASSRSMSIPGS